MKNLKKIVFGLLAMLVMVTSVNAAETFEECVSVKSNSTVCELDKDYTLENWLLVHKNLTIKLNGHTLTTNGAQIHIGSGAHLTIDGGDKGTLKFTGNYADARVQVWQNCTLDIDNLIIDAVEKNGDIDNFNTGVIKVYADKTNGGTLNIGKNTTINATDSVAIVGPVSRGANTIGHANVTIAGNLTSDGNTVTIDGQVREYAFPTNVTITKDAVITSTKAAGVYAAGYGIWTFEDGAKVTGNDALSIKSGSITINGGTYKATGEWTETPAANGQGAELTGAAISVTSNDSYAGDVQLTINGGKFVADHGSALYEYTRNEASKLQILKITNGEFVSGDKVENVVKMTKFAKSFIEGGTYSGKTGATIDEKYVVEGKASYENEKGETVLGELHKVTIGVLSSDAGVNVEKPSGVVEVPAGKEVNLRDVIMCGKKRCSAAKNTTYKFIYSGDLSGVNTFVMPEKDITLDVSVALRKEYTLTVNSIVNNGVELVKAFNSAKYLEGTEIMLDSTLLSAANQKTYTVAYTLTYNGQTVTGYGKFEMPEADAEIVLEVVKKADIPENPKPSDQPSQPQNPEDGGVDVGTKGDVTLSETDKTTLEESLEANKELQALFKDKNAKIELEAKDVKKESLAKEDLAKFETAIAGAKVAEFFDLSILVTADGVEGVHYLRVLDKAITITIDLPELPAVANGYTRKYYILREHDGKVEKLDATVKDGKVTFASDKFSTYALAYVDEKATVVNPTDDETNENPSTLDSIVSIVTLAISSLGTAGYSIKKFIRK